MVLLLLWKTAQQFLKKPNMKAPCHPAIALFDTYPREVMIHVHIKKSIQIFIADLFIIAPNWKQPRCPSAGEQLNKPVYL